MRVLPRSRWGKGLALAAIVLIALDVMTVFGSLRLFTMTTRITNGIDASLAGGAIQFCTGFEWGWTGQERWRSTQDRAWWPRTDYYQLSGRSSYTRSRLPLSLLYLPALVVMVFIERRDAKRSRYPNSCKACGYDLVGHSPDGVCPECGRARA